MTSKLTHEHLVNLIEALRRRMQRGELKFEGKDAKELTALLFRVSDALRK